MLFEKKTNATKYLNLQVPLSKKFGNYLANTRVWFNIHISDKNLNF